MMVIKLVVWYNPSLPVVFNSESQKKLNTWPKMAIQSAFSFLHFMYLHLYLQSNFYINFYIS